MDWFQQAVRQESMTAAGGHASRRAKLLTGSWLGFNNGAVTALLFSGLDAGETDQSMTCCEPK